MGAMQHRARSQPLRRRRAGLPAFGPVCASFLCVIGAAVRCWGVHAHASAAAGSWDVHAHASRVRACARACACEGASGAGGGRGRGHAGDGGDRACARAQCPRCRDSPSVDGGVPPSVCGECVDGLHCVQACAYR